MLYIMIFAVFLPTYRISLIHSNSILRKKQLIAQHYFNLISKI